MTKNTMTWSLSSYWKSYYATFWLYCHAWSHTGESFRRFTARCASYVFAQSWTQSNAWIAFGLRLAYGARILPVSLFGCIAMRGHIQVKRKFTARCASYVFAQSWTQSNAWITFGLQLAYRAHISWGGYVRIIILLLLLLLLSYPYPLSRSASVRRQETAVRYSYGFTDSAASMILFHEKLYKFEKS